MGKPFDENAYLDKHGDNKFTVKTLAGNTFRLQGTLPTVTDKAIGKAAESQDDRIPFRRPKAVTETGKIVNRSGTIRPDHASKLFTTDTRGSAVSEDSQEPLPSRNGQTVNA